MHIKYTSSFLNRVDPSYRCSADAAMQSSIRIVTALPWRNPESHISVTNVSFRSRIAYVWKNRKVSCGLDGRCGLCIRKDIHSRRLLSHKSYVRPAIT